MAAIPITCGGIEAITAFLRIQFIPGGLRPWRSNSAAAGWLDGGTFCISWAMKRCRGKVSLEAMERRVLFAAVSPTDYEQYMVELINRARANPEAEAAKWGINLDEGLRNGETISHTAVQPLAINLNLTD